MSRLQTRFADLKQQNRAALVTFVTAGDPDYDTSLAILKGLPGAGVRPFNWRISVPWTPGRIWRKPCKWFASSVKATATRRWC